MIRVLRVGSGEECEVRVDSPYVSGMHCRLEWDGHRCILEDLGSTNGTFLNGTKIIGRMAVVPTDSITLGRQLPLPWPKQLLEASRESHPAVPFSCRTGDAIQIGRAKDCHIVLDYPMVSHRHASVRQSKDGLAVRDLGSTNGTFVRGHRIYDEVIIQPGDVIGLGSYRLTVSADGFNLLQQDGRGSAILEANGVAVDVPGRRVLQDVTMVVKPGELIGIMGPSGAGKSSLLSALVGCQSPTEGRVTVSGADLYSHYDEFRGQIGYVPQDEIMHADLTVGQALWYAARLRLPVDFSSEEIDQRIERVIKQLGLVGTERTRIGSAARRGISGGQRKRVNIAMELLTDPPMLVLDEPTSGLSSTDAAAIVELLRDLARAGRTIVLTIHQPSIDVLKMLNGVAVIARDESSNDVGRLVWYGPAYPDAAEFFEPSQDRSGRPEADAILRGLSRRRVSDWLEAYRRSPAHVSWGIARLPAAGSAQKPEPRHRNTASVAVAQWWYLMQRDLAIKCADGWSTAIVLAQAPVIALLISLVFGAKATKSLTAASWSAVSAGVAMTCFLLALAAVWLGCSSAIREIVGERPIYRRERMAGLGVWPYLASKLIVLGLICGLQCSILLLVVRAGCGLGGSPGFAYAVLCAAAMSGVGLGLCISAVVRTAEAAVSLLPLVILPMVILGGSLLPLAELPPVAAAIADAMPSRWAFEALVVHEANGRSVLPVPTKDIPPKVIKQDLAEAWFPVQEWRSSRYTPLWILVAFSVAGIVATRTVLGQQDRR